MNLESSYKSFLAPRLVGTAVGHWSFAEMQQAFGWNSNQYAWFGDYPGSAELISFRPKTSEDKGLPV